MIEIATPWVGGYIMPLARDGLRWSSFIFVVKLQIAVLVFSLLYLDRREGEKRNNLLLVHGLFACGFDEN